jgi:hypothetical protein
MNSYHGTVPVGYQREKVSQATHHATFNLNNLDLGVAQGGREIGSSITYQHRHIV